MSPAPTSSRAASPRLGGLREDLTVNWGAAFFSRAFEPAVDWQQWTGDSPAALADTIRAKTPGGGTNWLAGLQGVQSALQSQPSAGSACQLVVWLTDGEIDLGSAQATADATNALCGARIDPDGAEPGGFGVLAALRQAGVVVIGTLLADGDQREEARVMWPLVEGSGVYGGGTATCGPATAPEGSVRGAVVDASDPAALASVFLELGARIAGGSQQALAADGTFWIDAGVSRIRPSSPIPHGRCSRPPAPGSAPSRRPRPRCRSAARRGRSSCSSPSTAPSCRASGPSPVPTASSRSATSASSSTTPTGSSAPRTARSPPA